MSASTLISKDVRAQHRFGQFGYSVLAFNILVIVWGAYVRASFSGDGCGDHWPFCNGQLLPHAQATKTIVEFIHRLSTGLDAPFVILLVYGAFKLFARQHPVRRYASWSLVFLLVEAALGAGLVLFKYVAHNASVGRAIYLSLHLTNTMLLLSALALTAWLAWTRNNNFAIRDVPARAVLALAIALIVSVTGAITALGDTLFPSSSLGAGMQQDWAAGSSFLLRLRVVHPAIAILGGLTILWIAAQNIRSSSSEQARTAATRVVGLVVFQLVVGGFNLGLLAPVWMQLFHLFTADLLWVALLLMAFETAQAVTPAPTQAVHQHA